MGFNAAGKTLSRIQRVSGVIICSVSNILFAAHETNLKHRSHSLLGKEVIMVYLLNALSKQTIVLGNLGTS